MMIKKQSIGVYLITAFKDISLLNFLHTLCGLMLPRHIVHVDY